MSQSPSQPPKHPKRPHRQNTFSGNSDSPWQNATRKSGAGKSNTRNSNKAQQKPRSNNATSNAKNTKAPNTLWHVKGTDNASTSLTMHRYPANRQHVSLQAWDAADELMITHLLTQIAQTPLPEHTNIVIMNDDFGALACALSSELFREENQSKYTLTWQSDSYIAKQGCLQNLAQNQLPTSHINFIDSMSPLPDNTGLALIKLPRAHALLEHQLASLQQLPINIIAAGKVKAVQTSVLQLFEKYLGTTTTSLAVKKARLIFSRGAQQTTTQTSPYPTIWKTDAPELTIHNHANVFSRGQLDIGARLLLDHLPDCSAKTVIDLGCGNGVLGLRALQQSEPEKMLFVDESTMAVACAKQNVAFNMPEFLSRCEFVSSDCLEAIPDQKAHVVLCNPPFHQQNALTDHIAWQMFQQAKQALHPGGELRVVANRHLQHHDKLKRLFGGYQVVASNQKFSILSAINK